MSRVMVVVGASGGIGLETVVQLARRGGTVIAVSRTADSLPELPNNVIAKSVDSHDETSIAQFGDWLDENDYEVEQLICCTGILHGKHHGQTVFPEKKLEELDPAQLSTYFQINAVIPALWLKHMVKHVCDDATLVFLSARVGSISDNRLGGWYGYRASKAALNMFIKTAAVEYKRRKKQTILVAYHPGTVDTTLSQPFQKNVSSEKLFTPSFTVSQLLTHIERLNAEHSPYYLDWEGKTVNW